MRPFPVSIKTESAKFRQGSFVEISLEISHDMLMITVAVNFLILVIFGMYVCGMHVFLVFL